MALIIKVLLENRLGKGQDILLQAKPGLSLLVEDETSRVLFDTGPDGTFLNNAQRMGVSLSDLTATVLSHGHYDHCGGVPWLPDNSRIICHPLIAQQRYSALSLAGRRWKVKKLPPHGVQSRAYGDWRTTNLVRRDCGRAPASLWHPRGSSGGGRLYCRRRCADLPLDSGVSHYLRLRASRIDRYDSPLSEDHRRPADTRHHRWPSPVQRAAVGDTSAKAVLAPAEGRGGDGLPLYRFMGALVASGE